MAEGPPPGSLPDFFELAVPDAWHAIDFIADLHLSAALPSTFGAFSAHLRHTSADAVFILGDLFEVWVGDDMGSLGFERQCVDLLQQVAGHRHLAFMVGNRDFLAGAELLRNCGMKGLPDPTVIEAWGRRILLSHGDALCLADEPYQAFRREVRSARWQSEFLARPLAERLRIAAEIRQTSKTRRQFDGATDVDIDVALALRWMNGVGASELVHGHTHRPGSNALADGFARHVLSDWDLDQAGRAEVLRLTRAGFVRLPPSAG